MRAKNAYEWKLKKKKHIEYLSANNVFDQDRNLLYFPFPFASLSNTFTYIITYNEFYVFPKCFGSSILIRIKS